MPKGSLFSVGELQWLNRRRLELGQLLFIGPQMLWRTSIYRPRDVFELKGPSGC